MGYTVFDNSPSESPEMKSISTWVSRTIANINTLLIHWTNGDGMSGWSWGTSWHWCGGRICIMQLTPSFQPGAKNFVHPHSPESYPISLSWKQIPFDLQTKEHLTEEKPFSFGHCPNYLSPSPGQAADGGPSWMSRLSFSIPPSVEVVRVACRPALHSRQKVSKMRKSSPWLV